MSQHAENDLLAADSDTAVSLLLAIRGGDLATLERLIDEHPGLASCRVGSKADGTRTPLHMATDWPGYFPNAPDVVRLLIGAGADPNARTTGRGEETPGAGSETPLQWAASSDDVEVAAALIDGGCDLESPDGSIGSPLANAVGYGCWNVARLLVARGATVDRLWLAAALGMPAKLEELLSAEPAPTGDDVSQAFWHACDAGQRRVAEYLLSKGADRHWRPDYGGSALDAARGLGTQQENVVEWLRGLGVASSEDPPDEAAAPEVRAG